MPIHDSGGSCSSSSDPFSRVRDQSQSQAICPVFRDQLTPSSLCNSSPGIDMSAEVSCGLGLPEGAGKVDTTEAGGRPHGFEAFGGEPIEATVLDPCDEAVAAELGDQA